MSEDEAQLPLPNVPFAVPELLAITSVISGYVAATDILHHRQLL